MRGKEKNKRKGKEKNGGKGEENNEGTEKEKNGRKSKTCKDTRQREASREIRHHRIPGCLHGPQL